MIIPRVAAAALAGGYATPFVSVGLCLFTLALVICVVFVRRTSSSLAVVVETTPPPPPRERPRRSVSDRVLESIPTTKYSLAPKLNKEDPTAHRYGLAPLTCSVRTGSTVERSGIDRCYRNPAEATDIKAAGEFRVPQASSELPSCPVCTEEFLENDDVRILPCGHTFHQHCIDPWLMRCAETCPIW